MLYILNIVGRSLAGITVFILLYVAFFMFEDQEGKLHNRLENLWIAVDDRTKQTNSKTTALFNKIGTVLGKSFSKVFGKKFVSMKSLAISMNLSLAGGFLSVVLLSLWHPASPYTRLDASHRDGMKASLFLVWVFGGLAIMPMIFDYTWVLIVSFSSIGLFMMAAGALFYIGGISKQAFQSQQAIIYLSFLSDYLAILVLRKCFASISKTVSSVRIATTMVALTLFSLLITIGPSQGSFWLNRWVPNFVTTRYEILAIELFFLNFTTAILCQIPVFMLALMLFHKLFWPVANRALYPLSRHKVVGKKKVLFGAAVVLSIYAFNFEHAAMKEIARMF